MSTNNPYQPTGEVSFDAFPTRQYGGIGRLAYVGGAFGLGIFQKVAAFAAARTLGENAAVFFILIPLASVVALIALASYRMINMGSSPWWGLGIIVPLLNLFVGLRCVMCPEGYADHKTLDTAGKIMAGLMIALIVVVILLVIYAGTSAP